MITGIDFSYAAQAWQEAGSHFTGTAIEWRRPSVIFRPRLFMDGSKYCALFGDNLMDGCGGFGDTPAEAMRDFDKNWKKSNDYLIDDVPETIKLNHEQTAAAEWLVARLGAHMSAICAPDDPDWQELERARELFLGIPVPETEPRNEIPGETK